MKKSYIKLFIFETILFILLILNSFVSSILSRYNLIICLVGLLAVFKSFFGFEKDRHRFIKDIIMDTVIFLIVFFLWYYIFGIIISFARIDNYYTVKSFFQILLPLTLSICLKEYLRYMILTKSEGCNVLIVTTCALFIFLDVTNSLYYGNYHTNYDIFMLLALTILPAISTNIAATYLSIKTGYKPIIIYLLITNLYVYLIPIIPNPNEYIYSLVTFLLPILYAYRVHLFFTKEKKKDEDVERSSHKFKILPLVVPTVIVFILVYFVSGYFHYHAIAIASGSMTPNIKKGDVVIVEKIDGKYDRLKEGQVIAFRHDKIVVVHRLVRIIHSNGKYYFYTKGDANEEEDGYAINESEIYGIVNYKIPYVGIPTVWLNEL